MSMSDRKMFEIWREREKLKAQQAKIGARVKKIDEAIIKEMDRRNVSSVTERGTGQRITMIAAERTVYFADKLRVKLAASAAGRRILQRCIVEELDMKAVASEVAAGNVPPRIIAACSEIKTDSPYLKGGGGGE